MQEQEHESRAEDEQIRAEFLAALRKSERDCKELDRAREAELYQRERARARVLRGRG